MHELTLFFLRPGTEAPAAPTPRAAAGCEHGWDEVPAAVVPRDDGTPRYRCRHCEAFGYRKRGRGPVRAYRCSVKECRGLAVERLAGRLVRGAMIWRCSGCLAGATAAAG